MLSFVISLFLCSSSLFCRDFISLLIRSLILSLLVFTLSAITSFISVFSTLARLLLLLIKKTPIQKKGKTMKGIRKEIRGRMMIVIATVAAMMIIMKVIMILMN